MTASYDTGLPRLGRDLALTFTGPAGAPWVDGDFATTTSYGPDGAPAGTDLGVAGGISAAKQLLVNRLRTIVSEQTGVGELGPLGHPQYGSQHESQIGQPNVDRTRNLVKLYVLEALQQEPRIRQIVSCVVAPRSQDPPAQVQIAVEVLLIDQDTPLNFVIPFNLAVGA
jgi:hypothetical protein